MSATRVASAKYVVHATAPCSGIKRHNTDMRTSYTECKHHNNNQNMATDPASQKSGGDPTVSKKRTGDH